MIRISTAKRETFDELTINRMRIQFFEPSLWSFHRPKYYDSGEAKYLALPTLGIEVIKGEAS